MRRHPVTCATAPPGPRHSALSSCGTGTFSCLLAVPIPALPYPGPTCRKGSVMDTRLRGKVALVTGSSKGIGKGTARSLARERAVVVVHGRDRPFAEEVAARQIVAQGGQACAATGDLTSDVQVAALVEAASAAVGGIDILVNNAGGSGAGGDWETADPADWVSAYDRKVLATVRTTMAVLPRMRAARWGRIINISSLAGLMPPAVKPGYSAAKAAMNAMSSSLAKAVAAEGGDREHDLPRHDPQRPAQGAVPGGRGRAGHLKGPSAGQDGGGRAAAVRPDPLGPRAHGGGNLRRRRVPGQPPRGLHRRIEPAARRGMLPVA